MVQNDALMAHLEAKRKKRKIITIVIIVIIATPIVAGFIMNALMTPAERALSNIERITGEVYTIDNAEELRATLGKLDELAAQFPEHKALVDSLKATTFAEKASQIEGREKSVRLRVAYDIAQKAVLKILKAPSTAKFPDFDEIEAGITKDGHYLTRFYVDAQNSFGAMIRETYQVVISYNKEVQSYNVVSFNKL